MIVVKLDKEKNKCRCVKEREEYLTKKAKEIKGERQKVEIKDRKKIERDEQREKSNNRCYKGKIQISFAINKLITFTHLRPK